MFSTAVVIAIGALRVNSISVKLGQWEIDNTRLCAMEPHLWLRKFLPWAGIELVTARLVGQHLTHWATRAPPPGEHW